VTFRNSPIATEADASMTPNTSIEALGRNSEHLVELGGGNLRDTHLVECHEASYGLSRTPSKAGDGEHCTQTVQRTEVQQTPGRNEERSRDRFLLFRDEWVKNRARDIRQAGSVSFNTCSEDTASITALNEFYKRRVFDGFKAEHRDEKELKIGMMQGLRDFESFPKDVAAAENLHMCRIVCREKSRHILMNTCRRQPKPRV
jgi:hypothetical protein